MKFNVGQRVVPVKIGINHRRFRINRYRGSPLPRTLINKPGRVIRSGTWDDRPFFLVEFQDGTKERWRTMELKKAEIIIDENGNII